MSEQDIYSEISRLLSIGKSGVLATVIRCAGSTPRKAGAKMLIRDDGSLVGTVGGGAVELKVRETAAGVLARGEPRLLRFELKGDSGSLGICGGEVEVFVEPLLPADALFIAGAGHVGQAIASIAAQLGFHAVIIDPRAEFNNSSRFPSPARLVLEAYAKGLSEAEIACDSYVVICTPDHVSDEECVSAVIANEARYIGMIGSVRKVRELKDRLLARGMPRDKLERLHAPIGLDIGAETPAEIAVSIMAEIISVKRAKLK